jgi:hypothetical protein
MKKINRIAAATAGLAIAVSVPLVVSSASADNDKGQGNQSSQNSSNSSSIASLKVTLTQTQANAITLARKNYLTAASAAHQAWRSSLMTIQNDLLAAISTPRLNVVIAQDAYDFAKDTKTDTTAAAAALTTAQTAYQSAATAAKASAQTKTTAVKSTAQASLAKAKTDYQTAVTASFPSGTVVPPSLLIPPRDSFSWMHANENWNFALNSNGLALGHLKR